MIKKTPKHQHRPLNACSTHVYIHLPTQLHTYMNIHTQLHIHTHIRYTQYTYNTKHMQHGKKLRREGVLTLLQSNYTNHVLDLLHCTNRCAVRFPLIYFSHSPCQSSAVINESRGPQRAKDGRERESIPSEAPLPRTSDSNIAIVKGPHLPRTRKSHLVCIVEETSQIIVCYTMEKNI